MKWSIKMTHDRSDTKKKIIDATIEIMKTEKDVDKIALRQIAKKANVAPGLINYHFQTRENLIDTVVQLVIGDSIEQGYEYYDGLKEDPMTKLRHMVKLAADLVFGNPEISRISIANDMLHANDKDNAMQTSRAFFSYLKNIYGEKKSELELKIIVHLLTSAAQVAFLRKDVFKRYTGIDHDDKNQRDSFLDMLIDILIKSME